MPISLNCRYAFRKPSRSRKRSLAQVTIRVGGHNALRAALKGAHGVARPFGMRTIKSIPVARQASEIGSITFYPVSAMLRSSQIKSNPIFPITSANHGAVTRFTLPLARISPLAAFGVLGF